MMVAEMKGQSSLKTKIRSFLDLFAVEKNNLILTLINDNNWTRTTTFRPLSTRRVNWVHFVWLEH